MPHLSIDELDIMRTLGVAVTSTILSTSLVAGEFGHAAIRVHLDKVDGTVEATGELGHVNVERELLVLQLEELVSAVVLEEVDTRADVGVRARGDELEREGAATCGDTVGSLVVRTIDSTVLFE